MTGKDGEDGGVRRRDSAGTRPYPPPARGADGVGRGLGRHGIGGVGRRRRDRSRRRGQGLGQA